MRLIDPLFSMAVNLSAQLLEAPILLGMVTSALKKHNFPAQNLVLEVTETANLARSSAALQVMRDFRALGIHLSVDDYGTGNATMDYLKLLPSDEVKIDKSFVANIDTNRDDRLMVESTINLVHSLGRRVVAEGVESQAVYEHLRALGCDMIQGYLISRPVTLGELIAQLPQASQRVANHS
jgi:EAL domain-containing protein (putative c-di-GMP-specific phosphodiesterase class I)